MFPRDRIMILGVKHPLMPESKHMQKCACILPHMFEGTDLSLPYRITRGPAQGRGDDVAYAVAHR